MKQLYPVILVASALLSSSAFAATFCTTTKLSPEESGSYRCIQSITEPECGGRLLPYRFGPDDGYIAEGNCRLEVILENLSGTLEEREMCTHAMLDKHWEGKPKRQAERDEAPAMKEAKESLTAKLEKVVSALPSCKERGHDVKEFN
jgi:hypothetical protein